MDVYEDPELQNVIIQIKDCLLKENVKLWTEPYYNDTKGSSEQNLKILAKEYHQRFKLPLEVCLNALIELQNNALSKLKQREKYNETGIATLKIKAVRDSRKSIFHLETSLNTLGLEFKKAVAKELKVTSKSIKLITNGKLVNDEDTLGKQGVKNAQVVLAIILEQTPENVVKSEEKYKEVESVKEDMKLLLNRDDGQFLQLEDQYGNKIDIPDKERKSLILSIALHEKGRTAIKKNDHAEALIYLLEADNDFRNCHSALLDLVDNYAVLDLDITWCYLCIHSVSYLPEAYQRLKRCEERFNKSYGPNLERVIALKGTAVNEATLLLRLHLLQAIVLFYQNKRQEAKELFKKVEIELNDLKVDDDKILTLVELGFSIAEARVGLRANRGDLSLAANYLNDNRRQRAEKRKQEIAEKILEKEKKKLGKCIDGEQYVDANFLKMLIAMGFNKESARVALQNSNNVISSSIQYMQENPTPGPSSSVSQEMLKLINDLTPELESVGFDSRMVKLALQKHDGDVFKAAEELVENDGMIDGDFSAFEEFEATNITKSEKEIEDQQKMNEAYDRLQQEITVSEFDYLDISLTDEQMFLEQFLALLKDD